MPASADLLADLEARGLVHDLTDRAALGGRLAEGPMTLYHGIDPSADSLHVGNLVGILVLRRFQRFGHRPIALAGGATGMIGDPGGRSSERNLLDPDTLGANLAGIKGQLEQLLDFGAGSRSAELVDNASWTGELRLLDFLRDVGKHATVNAMVAKESVRARMQGDEGISFTEFAYMLVQANDFLWLHEHEGCDLQVGGSDQWGNITAGIDLVRRRVGRRVHGLTWPLLLRSDGRKFGKSEGGNEDVWLSASRTTPYRFFQHWMQVADADVGRFLLQLTLLDLEEARSVIAAHSAAPERRVGQRRLAQELTTLVHGADAATAAADAAHALFGADLESLPPGALAALDGEVDTTALGAG
ncbi:MAG: tyrosine--tRNA ligase, partial [Actinomycetota bacterium]|nr:tyrosine--tRNA ligase [Actinomycetota bacterium]